jgi:hypothetical protein
MRKDESFNGSIWPLAHLDALKSLLRPVENSATYIPKGRCSVSNANEPVRSWEEITEEASRERDPRKIQELAKEL